MERLPWTTPGKRRFGALLTRSAALGFCLLIPTAWGAKFTATLDRSAIMLGESVTLTLNYEGGQQSSVVTPPTVPNLQIAYTGQSSQFSFGGGQSVSILTHNYTVTPRQPGDYIIPAITVTLGDRQLASPPLQLKVMKPSAPSPEALAAGNQPVFLRLHLPKPEVYVGELLTAELQVYVRDGVELDGWQFTATPAEGFTIGKMAEAQRRRAQVGNAVYTVIPVLIPLTAIKAGPAKLGPITANVVVRVPTQNRRRDVFDPFGMFAERRQLAIASEEGTALSRSLPMEDVPPGFTGAVGQYTMTVNAGPTEVATGDPITVRVQISGRGALDAITLPPQNAWHDFKAYPPTAAVEYADALGLQGTKTFEQVVAPQSADIRELPPFTFSFFDPEAGAYRTLGHPATALSVRPGGSVSAPVVAATRPAGREVEPPPQDIVPIKQRPGRVVPPSLALVAQPWFLAAQTVPVLALVAAFVWRKRTDNLANNPRLRRQRQVAQLVNTGLAELRRLAAAHRTDEFFATLFRLMQEQIGERLNLPASSITEAIIDERLKSTGLADGDGAKLHQLFQTCNQARYAPLQSPQELAALVPQVEHIIAQLRRLKP